MASGGVESTWKEVAAQTAVDTMLRFMLKSTLAAKAATAPPQQQLTTAQQQARAAEAALAGNNPTPSRRPLAARVGGVLVGRGA